MASDVDPEDLADPESLADEPLLDEPLVDQDVAEWASTDELTPDTDPPLEASDADWLDQQREPPADDEEDEPR